jgi:LPS export ABC transporter protein LptC/lipopolysaccharide transport protein LptA
MNVEKIKRMLLVTIFVMVVIMGYYIHEYIKTKGPVIPEPIPDVPDADVVVNDFEVIETLHNRELWRLRAKIAKKYSAQQETLGEEIEADFFNENGKNLHLTGDYGRIDEQTGNIIASGNVQATVVEDGATLKTEELLYNAETGKITTDKHIIIERGTMITEGEGLESDSSLKKAKILQNIMTTLKMSEEASPIVIVSDVLQLDELAQLAIYKGNVTVTQLSSEIKADKMLVYSNERKNTIDRIEVFGNVQITTDNILATGEEGEYTSSKQEAVIRGNAKKQAYAEDKTTHRSLNADIIRVFLATNDFEGEGNVKFLQTN